VKVRLQRACLALKKRKDALTKTRDEMRKEGVDSEDGTAEGDEAEEGVDFEAGGASLVVVNEMMALAFQCASRFVLLFTFS
jgi:hypothetical protein